ncbi:MAG: DUF4383 domain-containing protein [Actinophytocola sp.]|nr:DUF4383 domain-containing protein [Actinophytocola sp.]
MNAEPEIQRAHKAGVKEGTARSIARITAGVLGVVLIAAGVLGFIYGDSSFTVGDQLGRGEFLGFDVNGWHNIVHIATGAFLLLMMPTTTSAITGLLVFAVVYAAVTVWGFVTGTDVAWIVPVDTADNILHAALVVVALIVAIAAGGIRRGAKRT